MKTETRSAAHDLCRSYCAQVEYFTYPETLTSQKRTNEHNMNIAYIATPDDEESQNLSPSI